MRKWHSVVQEWEACEKEQMMQRQIEELQDKIETFEDEEIRAENESLKARLASLEEKNVVINRLTSLLMSPVSAVGTGMGWKTPMSASRTGGGAEDKEHDAGGKRIFSAGMNSSGSVDKFRSSFPLLSPSVSSTQTPPTFTSSGLAFSGKNLSLLGDSESPVDYSTPLKAGQTSAHGAHSVPFKEGPQSAAPVVNRGNFSVEFK
jgi:hypothetical protein